MTDRSHGSRHHVGGLGDTAGRVIFARRDSQERAVGTPVTDILHLRGERSEVRSVRTRSICGRCGEAGLTLGLRKQHATPRRRSKVGLHLTLLGRSMVALRNSPPTDRLIALQQIQEHTLPTEIKQGTSLVTLVNVFTTTPETQRQLLDLLTSATTETMARQPGFVSANFHASTDGLRVVNYAQWESVEALEAMRANPECQEHMHKAEGIATVDMHFYDVVATLHALKD